MFSLFKKKRLKEGGRMEFKKVLVGSNHLSQLGGSEVYTYTLIKTLNQLGYEVCFTTLIEGSVSERCKEFALFIEPEYLSDYKFEVAIVSHNSVLKLPLVANKIIQVCHGALPGLEEPSKLADFHVSVSKGVYNHVKSYGLESQIINNMIDFSRFYPKTRINDRPKRILSLCQGDEANKNVEQACEKLGIEFDSLSKTRSAVWDLEDRIMKADIVVSYGRGVWEAMACGRNAIVYDSRGYFPNQGDGMVDSDNFDSFLKLNCTGRVNLIDFDTELLVKEIKKFDPDQGNKNHQLAKKYFDSHLIVKEILGINVEKSQSRILYMKIIKEKLNKFVSSKETGIIYFVSERGVIRMQNSDHLDEFNKKYRKGKDLVIQKLSPPKQKVIDGLLA